MDTTDRGGSGRIGPAEPRLDDDGVVGRLWPLWDFLLEDEDVLEDGVAGAIGACCDGGCDAVDDVDDDVDVDVAFCCWCFPPIPGDGARRNGLLLLPGVVVPGCCEEAAEAVANDDDSVVVCGGCSAPCDGCCVGCDAALGVEMDDATEEAADVPRTGDMEVNGGGGGGATSRL